MSVGERRYVCGDYLAANADWHAADSPWKVQHILRMLAKNGISPTTVCEIGCGAGEILRQIQLQLPASCRLSGYDISPQAIALCAPKANDHLIFREGLPARGGGDPFDVMLLIDVIEHIDDYRQWLRDIHPLSQWTVLHIPLDLSAQGVLREWPLLETRRQVGHIHYFTQRLALEALGESGYEVIDSFFTAGSIELPSTRLQTRLARLPRKLLFGLRPDLCARLLGGCSLMVLAR